MSTPDINDCPLGQALRAVREGTPRRALDWSQTPLGQFTAALTRQLAEQRARHIEGVRRRGARLAARRWGQDQEARP